MNKLIETLAALNLSSATTKITRLKDRYEFKSNYGYNDGYYQYDVHYYSWMLAEVDMGGNILSASPAPETLALNYESIGFAIGFKKATAKEVLELANGNTARLIPALQWLYKQTSEEGLRQRIQEITLDVLFN